MVFSSIAFVAVFLPIVFVLYYLLPGIKAKNILLIIASFIFYAYGEPVYVILMLVSCIFNYLISLGIAGADKFAKPLLIFAVIINMGSLFAFKYTGFAVENINHIFKSQIPVPAITLPIGISFFTFQALSYVIDVYRNPKQAQKNILNIFLYISFFPQLIAGPIVKFYEIEKQIDNRTADVEKIAGGCRRFIIGLSKKLLIANVMALAVDNIFAYSSSELNIASAWIAAIAYAFQIYYDFSGYSDMALGLAAMFGFKFNENFRHPYQSDSVQDFWRRWHISLSTWFKEYLYIPLGGNRKGRLRTVLNKYIVFFCTGLWHGANWTFIIWGLFHGSCLMLEESRASIKSIKWKPLRQVCTFILVVIAFVIFRADNMSQAGIVLSKMFTGFDFSTGTMQLMLKNLTPVFIISLIAGFVFMREYDSERLMKYRAVRAASWVVSVLLLVLCMMNLSSGTYNPFIYFRF